VQEGGEGGKGSQGQRVVVSFFVLRGKERYRRVCTFLWGRVGGRRKKDIEVSVARRGRLFGGVGEGTGIENDGRETTGKKKKENDKGGPSCSACDKLVTIKKRNRQKGGKGIK
jgi:hypothetical protein